MRCQSFRKRAFLNFGTRTIRMAKLSRVDWRSSTEPGRSPSKTESSTPRDQELNDSSRNKAKRIRIVHNTTQHRVIAKTCGSATVHQTRLFVAKASRRRQPVLHKADHPQSGLRLCRQKMPRADGGAVQARQGPSHVVRNARRRGLEGVYQQKQMS